MPWGKPGDPTLVDVTVHPANRVMRAGNTQQIVVLARYSDGRTEDITRRAQYESNATDIATVDGGALVRAGESSGEATVMVRYQDRVATLQGHGATFKAFTALGVRGENPGRHTHRRQMA